jgi:predicted GIY-YIG superfamily endonuclease
VSGYRVIPLDLPQRGQWFVYTIVDELGLALYVGMTDNWARRVGQHSTKAWWDRAKRASVRTFTSKHEAEREEYRLIRRHEPEGNYTHSRRRAVEMTDEDLAANIAALERWRALGVNDGL